MSALQWETFLQAVLVRTLHLQGRAGGIHVPPGAELQPRHPGLAHVQASEKKDASVVKAHIGRKVTHVLPIHASLAPQIFRKREL